MPSRRAVEAGLGVLAAVLLALAILTLGWCSTAHADIQIDSSGRTLGAPLLRSYLPNGTAHLQGLVVCDRVASDRCISVQPDGSISVTLSAPVSITGTVNTALTSPLPAGTNVIGHVICDSGCSSSSSPSYGTAFPSTGTPVGFSDGTNLVPGRVKTTAITGGDPGLVVRPFMPSDGTNVMPAGDSSARSIHMTIDNASTAVNLSAPIPSGTNVIGHIICDSGCSSSVSPSFGAAFPATGTPVGFTDGTNMVAARVRTGLIGASDAGIVVRPFMPSDGTNTMPAGDSSARSIHVTVDNGSATATENSSLTLGTAAVAEAISLNYGAVVLTPSTMTLGTNGTGMRASYAAAGQTIMQLNAPLGDWTTGKNNATGTGDTALVAALGSGVRFCMTDWAITNDSATDSSLRFRDGTTDLTERIMVPNKGGNNKALITPICTTANTALNFAADTGVTTMRVTVRGYKTKE